MEEKVYGYRTGDIAINLTLSSVLDICISLFDMSYVRSRNGEMAGVKCKEYKS